ncbi:Ig-like domain-containing protein [Aldersonia kunmingensis]|uniref:Ig-like domain-containing protein n=1 Tax=Aldersonia kunmingensis TaxID=408066 RepID=UPI000830A478|nr:Ig-like domain-containing protein [Aldersonia kunmingensis]
MQNKKLRRLLAGASTAAIAAGFAASLGMGAASAAPVSQSTEWGQWTFNRTISNGTPAPGDTITVTNNLRFNGGLAPTISEFRDFHPACLTYVAGSSRVEGNNVTTNATDPAFVKMTGSWIRSAVDRNISYTLNYTVGANCGRDIALTTGTGVSANQGLGSENQTAGPSLTVPKSASTASVAVSPAPKAGVASTLTATVPAGATGTVEFADNGTVLGTGTVSNGTATYSWTPAAAASYSITAKYLGDAAYLQSTSAPQTGTVSAADVVTSTTLTVPATANNSVPVDLVATVSPAPSGGTVQFKDGNTNIGAPVAVTGGTATLSQAFSSDGAHEVTAVYSGTGGFAGSTSAASTVTVTSATTTTVTAPNHAKTGVAVNIAATVNPAPASGTVQFFDGGTPIGAPVTVAGSVAVLAHTFDTAGIHAITASFSGAPGFAASAAPATSVEVSNPAPNEVATTTVLTAPATASTDQSVTLSANVDPAQAGGTVQFFDGTTAIGGAVPVTAGGATLAYTFTAAGAHGVTAVYSGAPGFLGSSSDARVINVSDSEGPGTGGTPSFGSSN